MLTDIRPIIYIIGSEVFKGWLLPTCKMPGVPMFIQVNKKYLKHQLHSAQAIYHLNVFGLVWISAGFVFFCFLYTFAASPIFLKDVPFRTWTLEAPLCVFADEIARFGGLVTFIQV